MDQQAQCTASFQKEKKKKYHAGCRPQKFCQHPGGCRFIILWVYRGSNTVLLCLATNSGQQFKGRGEWSGVGRRGRGEHVYAGVFKIIDGTY